MFIVVYPYVHKPKRSNHRKVGHTVFIVHIDGNNRGSKKDKRRRRVDSRKETYTVGGVNKTIGGAE